MQASANGKFRQNLDNVFYATFFSICGTILTATLFLLITRPPLPSAESVRSTQWWNWIGGPLGALIVLAGATLTPKIGAAAFISAVVAGQLLSSMLLDHFGLMGLPVRPITLGRIIGIVLVVLGVIAVKYL